jgi:Flp pilus assembly pilin Flp
MSKLSRMWQDDHGAVIATEYLFVVTILVIGIIVGLSNLRAALNAELTELGNAILALSQGYTIQGELGAGASVDGSQAIDTPGYLNGSTQVPPSAPSLIDIQPSN